MFTSIATTRKDVFLTMYTSYYKPGYTAVRLEVAALFYQI